MHFQTIVWFIEFWPAAYQVLSECALETKDMGLIFHKSTKKVKNGIKEETGWSSQNVKLRNIVFFSKREIIKVV